MRGLGPAYNEVYRTFERLPELLRVNIVFNELDTPATTGIANIANADALIVIVGHTRKNVNIFGTGSHRSTPEKEIAQSEMRGKPILALLYEPTPQDLSDASPSLIKLKQHLVEHWEARTCTSTEELNSPIVGGIRLIADAMNRSVDEEGIDSIVSQHLGILSLMREGHYEQALLMNTAMLKERPFSPRANYNAACINCWLARSETGEQRRLALLRAKSRLSDAIKYRIGAFLSLAGVTDREEQIDRILGDPDLEPVFQEWPGFRAAVAAGGYWDVAVQGGCIAYDAMIALADGRFAPVQDLRVGDRVHSFITGVRGEGVVTAIDVVLASALIHADGQPLCTEEQPFWINGVWGAADTLLESNPRYSLALGDAVAFALHVSPTHTFVVNGHLAHNK